MGVLVFIFVIVVLIVVHEFGHFLAAKWANMRVDEFGIGFPPRAAVIGKSGETDITLNWLPFGGFVKIYGEDGLPGQAKDNRAFSARPRLAQAIVLVAGVAMNMVLAYLLITAALVIGTPRALLQDEIPLAKEVSLAVASVLPGSPAAEAGLAAGDIIIGASDGNNTWQADQPDKFTTFIAQGSGREVALSVKRDAGTEIIKANPASGIISSDPSRYALGVEVAPIGVIPISLPSAIVEGAQLTWGATVLTAQGLWNFFSGVFTFQASLAQVTGPVGIAGAVGAASAAGLGNLLSLMAIISINLAIINLIPIPALDGGRLLFVIIESIIRRPINLVFARSLNALGFILLIVLMVVVTAHDIFKIIG